MMSRRSSQESTGDTRDRNTILLVVGSETLSKRYDGEDSLEETPFLVIYLNIISRLNLPADFLQMVKYGPV